MKIKVLQHSPTDHLPARRGDPTPTSRNLDPDMHPFARARERMRALNAVKMERMFAKPFVAALEGHVDAVQVMARKPNSLTDVASASWDGELIVHDIARRNHVVKIADAHKGKISGICWSPSEEDRLLSCGSDMCVKIWDTANRTERGGDVNMEAGPSQKRKPVAVFNGKFAFNSIDHHRHDPIFATASSVLQVWDETKTTPISNITHPTSNETISSLRFAPSEPSVLASVGSDRTFILYDIRTSTAERRTILSFRANALAWSPTFPTTVLLASEDHNLYTFDVRQLNTPTQIYKGHVSAVMSCDWSPTGTEFVSGGWDRTVRIWQEGVGKQPEIYHTKRMQRVLSTVYSSDARYVLSGSDEGNMRIWKARASDKLAVVNTREKAAMEYRDALRERWKFDEEVSKVSRSRRIPKPVHKATHLKHTMLDARRVKEERRRKHTRAGASKPMAERKKIVLVEQS